MSLHKTNKLGNNHGNFKSKYTLGRNQAYDIINHKTGQMFRELSHEQDGAFALI